MAIPVATMYSAKVVDGLTCRCYELQAEKRMEKQNANMWYEQFQKLNENMHILTNTCVLKESTKKRLRDIAEKRQVCDDLICDECPIGMFNNERKSCQAIARALLYMLGDKEDKERYENEWL